MPRDRSLDEFLQGDGEDGDDGEIEEGSPDDGPSGAGEDEADPSGTGEDPSSAREDGEARSSAREDGEDGQDPSMTDEDPSMTDEDPSVTDDDGGREVQPPRPTFGWSPDGRECESCGRRVTRHWREGERRVCDRCVEW